MKGREDGHECLKTEHGGQAKRQGGGGMCRAKPLHCRRAQLRPPKAQLPTGRQAAAAARQGLTMVPAEMAAESASGATACESPRAVEAAAAAAAATPSTTSGCCIRSTLPCCFWCAATRSATGTALSARVRGAAGDSPGAEPQARLPDCTGFASPIAAAPSAQPKRRTFILRRQSAGGVCGGARSQAAGHCCQGRRRLGAPEARQAA